MRGYVEQFVEGRRAGPRDDLVTAIQAEEEGDRLNALELRDDGGLLFAGYDTTRNQLGIRHFYSPSSPTSGR